MTHVSTQNDRGSTNNKKKGVQAGCTNKQNNHTRSMSRYLKLNS